MSQTKNEEQVKQKEDIVSILTDAFFSAAKGSVKFMASPILKSVGLEKMPTQPTTQTSSLVPDVTNDRSNPRLNVSKDVDSILEPVAPEVKKILNLGNVFIQNNQDGVTSSVRLLANTASLQVNAALEQINESLNDAGVRESLKKFVSTGESLVIELEPLVAEVVTQLVRMGINTGGEIMKAMVIISIEMAAAIPGLGTFINLAKATGSGALLLYQVVDNARTSFVISGELLGRVRDVLQGEATGKQKQEGGKKNDIQQIGGRITRRMESRINASIQQFTNPIANQTIKKRRRQNTRRRGRH